MRRILTAAFAAATLLMGCRQNGETKLGPDSTLEEFYRNLCSGQFTQAEGLCDKTAMEEYFKRFASDMLGGDAPAKMQALRTWAAERDAR